MYTFMNFFVLSQPTFMAEPPPPPPVLGMLPPPKLRLYRLFELNGGENNNTLFVKDDISNPLDKFDAGIKIQGYCVTKYSRRWFSDNPPTWYCNQDYKYVDRRHGNDILGHRILNCRLVIPYPVYDDFDLIGHYPLESVKFVPYSKERAIKPPTLPSPSPLPTPIVANKNRFVILVIFLCVIIITVPHFD